MVHKHLSHGKILKILVVGNDVDLESGTLKVMTPDFEAFKDGEKLLVVGVIVMLSVSEGTGVEGDQVDVAIGSDSGNNASQGIVRSISFNEDRIVGGPMCEDGSFSEGLLESAKCLVTLVTPVPGCAFVSKVSEGNNNVGIIEYKASVKVCKSQEGLNLLNGSRSGPFEDSVNLGLGHRNTGGIGHKAKEFSSVNIKFTFFSFGIKLMFLKASKNFSNMFIMFLRSLGVNEDIVQIDYHIFVKDVREDAVHITLESSRSIGEAEVHDHKIKGTIMSSEGGFPFITRSDVDEVVGTMEVNLGVDGGGAEAIKEVGNEQKWVSVFLGDGIKTMPINTKTERAVLLFDEKNRCATGGLQVADEITTEIFFKEALECFGFSFQGRIDWTKRWVFAFFEVDMVVELWAMIREFISFGLTENIDKWLTFGRNL